MAGTYLSPAFNQCSACSVLTKKLIRTQYQSHFSKASVTREEKDKINEVLEMVVQELADQTRVPFI